MSLHEYLLKIEMFINHNALLMESMMKSILTGILSLFIFFGAVPAVQAVPAQACEMTCEMACADEDVKKKKKKGKKIGGKKGKKSKKGFFSKIFGSK